MLVLALFSVAAAAVYPLGKTLYDRYLFREVFTGVQSAVEIASLRAQTGYHDADHGVKLLEDQYVLFEGPSYALREEAHDSIVPLPSTVSLTGPDEFVFSKITGTATATGTLTVANGNMERSMTIRTTGVIE